MRARLITLGWKVRFMILDSSKSICSVRTGCTTAKKRANSSGFRLNMQRSKCFCGVPWFDRIVLFVGKIVTSYPQLILEAGCAKENKF